MRTVAVLCALTCAFGCKGKPNPQAAPPPTPQKVETGSGSSIHQDTEIPHGPGTPPLKSSKNIDPAVLKKMSEMTFPGFSTDVRALNDRNLWVYQKTVDHPIIRVSIRVWPCDGCWPMELAKWQEKKDDVKKNYMSEGLRNDPKTQFELGETDLYGTKMIYTYQLGQIMGDTHNEFTHAYVLYYNDGINEIRAIAEYKDDMMKGTDEMVKAVPKEDLANAAKGFVDVYTHAWL